MQQQKSQKKSGNTTKEVSKTVTEAPTNWINSLKPIIFYIFCIVIIIAIIGAIGFLFYLKIKNKNKNLKINIDEIKP